MKQADSAAANAGVATQGVKRAVVVADNQLIVATIRAGARESGAIRLLGYVDPRRATAARIAQVGAQVVLVDDAEENSEISIALIRSIKERDPGITVLVLTRDMEGERLHRAFQAGANGAMSKTLHPAALTTLVREAVSGHIIHAPTAPRRVGRTPLARVAEHDALTTRELETLQLLASGARNSDIARRLWVTQQTVKFHVSNIYRKLGVANRTEACHYVHVNGLTTGADTRRPTPRGPLVIT